MHEELTGQTACAKGEGGGVRDAGVGLSMLIELSVAENDIPTAVVRKKRH